MKKWVAVCCVILAVTLSVNPAFGAKSGPNGPAPNSGDGIPDQSGHEDDHGAPNSGDGIPDGSGW